MMNAGAAPTEVRMPARHRGVGDIPRWLGTMIQLVGMVGAMFAFIQYTENRITRIEQNIAEIMRLQERNERHYERLGEAVAELRRAEARLNALFEGTRGGTKLLDSRGPDGTKK